MTKNTEILVHPPYAPALTHPALIFPHQWNILDGERFISCEAVKTDLSVSFHRRLKTFMPSGLIICRLDEIM